MWSSLIRATTEPDPSVEDNDSNNNEAWNDGNDYDDYDDNDFNDDDNEAYVPESSNVAQLPPHGHEQGLDDHNFDTVELHPPDAYQQHQQQYQQQRQQQVGASPVGGMLMGRLTHFLEQVTQAEEDTYEDHKDGYGEDNGDGDAGDGWGDDAQLGDELGWDEDEAIDHDDDDAVGGAEQTRRNDTTVGESGSGDASLGLGAPMIHHDVRATTTTATTPATTTDQEDGWDDPQDNNDDDLDFGVDDSNNNNIEDEQQPELIPEHVADAQQHLQIVLQEIDAQEEVSHHYETEHRLEQDEEDALSQDEKNRDEAIREIQQEMGAMTTPVPPVVDHMPAELTGTMQTAAVDPSLRVFVESEDLTRDSGPDVVSDNEVIYDNENEQEFGPVVDQIPAVPDLVPFKRNDSMAVQAQGLQEDLDKDEAMDESVVDDAGDGWAGEDDFDDEELDIVIEDIIEPQVTLVDHTPPTPAPASSSVRFNSAQSIDVLPSDGDTVDVEPDDEKDMDKNHEYGPVVDQIPPTPAVTMYSAANSNVAHASVLAEDFEEDDAMDETCFGDSTVDGRTLDGRTVDGMVSEYGWDEEHYPIAEDEEVPPEVMSITRQTLSVLVPPPSGEPMVDYTPAGSPHGPTDPSVVVLAEPEDLTRDTGDGDDEVVYDDENEEAYGRVVDHTPKTPISSVGVASGANSLAVHASALESEFREDDAMDETDYGDSTIADGTMADGWDQEDLVVEVGGGGSGSGDEQRERRIRDVISPLNTGGRPVALVDHTPSEMGTSAAKLNTDPSIAALASKGETDDGDNDSQGVNVVFGLVVDQLPPTPRVTQGAPSSVRSDSIVAQTQDLDTIGDTIGETMVGGSTVGPGGSTAYADGSTVGGGDSEIDEEMPAELRDADDQLVDHVPQRPASRFGDASILVAADPSEVLSEVDDMGQEEGYFGPVVDVTPLSRSSMAPSELPSGAGSTVAFAPASVAADDLDDADETVLPQEENEWDQDDVPAPNPQSGNEEPVVERVNEQLVDFLPPQDAVPDLVSADGREQSSEVAVGGAISLTQPTEDPIEDDFGPVVDLTPSLGISSVAATGVSIASTSTQLTASECRALEKDDRAEGIPEDADPVQSKVVVDHLPNMRDKRIADSTATAKSQLSEEEVEEDDDDIAKFGPVVDHLPTSRSSLAPSRGGSTVDALATVSEVNSDQDQEEGGGWDDDADFDVSESGISDRAGILSAASNHSSTFRRASGDLEKTVSVRFEPSLGKSYSDDLSRSASEGQDETQYFDSEIVTSIKQDETQYYDPEAAEGTGWDDDDIVIDEPELKEPDISDTSFAEAETPPSTPYRKETPAREATIESPVSDLQLSMPFMVERIRCVTCVNAKTIECPCVKKLIHVNSKTGALVGTLLTPEGESVQIDLEKLLEDEIVKRRLVEEESLTLREASLTAKRSSDLEAELLKLRAQNESLSGKIGGLEIQCTGLRKEKNGLDLALKDSCRYAADLEQEKGEWVATKSAFEAESKHLKEAIADSVSQTSSDVDLATHMTKLQVDFAAKTGRCEELVAHASQLQERLEESQYQVTGQVRERETLSTQYALETNELREQVLESQRHLRDASRSRDNAVEKARDVLKELESVQKVKVTLEKQVGDLIIQHEGEMERQYELIDRKTTEVRALEESFKKLKGEKTSLAADLLRQRSLAEQSESLASELLSVAQERDLLQEALAESKEAIVSLQNHIDEHGMEQESLESKRGMEVQQLKAELKDIKDLTMVKDSEIVSLGAKADSIEKEKDSLAQDLQDTESSRRSLEAAVEHGKLLVIKAEAEVAKKGKELQSLRHQLAQVSSDHQRIEAESQRLMSRVSELELTLQQAVDDAKSYSSTVRDVEGLLVTSNAEVQTLVLERDSLQADKEHVLAQCRDIKAQSCRSIDEAQRHAEEASQRYESTVAGLKIDCDELSSQLAERQAVVEELEEARAELAIITNERDILADDNEEMLVQFGILKEQMDLSDEEVKRMQCEIEKLELESSSGQGQSNDMIDTLRREYDTLNSTFGQATSEKERLASLASDLESQYKQLENQNHHHQDEIKQLHENIAALQQPDDVKIGLQVRVGDYEAECLEKNRIIEANRVEINRLLESQQQAEQTTNEIRALGQKMGYMEKELQEKSARVHQLESLVDRTRGELDVSKEDLTRTEAALNAQEELTALESARHGHDMNGETSALKNRLESLGAALQSTRARLAAKEEEMDQLASNMRLVQSQQSVEREIVAPPPIAESAPEDEDDVGSLRSHVVSLAVALERSENRRAEAIDRLLSERQVNADSIRRLSESVKRFYSTVSFGDA
jgi:chromosome segregation ATPase